MKCSIPVVLLFLSHSCYCRVASSEAEIEPEFQPKISPLRLPCYFRTIEEYEPYPSVIVIYQEEVQKLSWDLDGKENIVRNYKHPVPTHSYPPSAGLSGAEPSTTPPNPFRNAPVIDDKFTWEDIVNWFRESCVKPHSI